MVPCIHVVIEGDIAKINQVLENPSIDFSEALDVVFKITKEGFDIWATKDNYPKGWDRILAMDGKRLDSPSILLARCIWEKIDVEVIGLRISTNCSELKNSLNLNEKTESEKRLEDIQWSIENIIHLCKIAGVNTPPLFF